MSAANDVTGGGLLQQAKCSRTAVRYPQPGVSRRPSPQDGGAGKLPSSGRQSVHRGKRKCPRASQASHPTGSQTVGEAARTEIPRLSFSATGTRRSLHRRFRLVPIPAHRRSRRRSAWNARRRSIGSGARRLSAIARLQGSSILEFGHRCQSRRGDGKHSGCAEPAPTRHILSALRHPPPDRPSAGHPPHEGRAIACSGAYRRGSCRPRQRV